jgi:hypothetical protein
MMTVSRRMTRAGAVAVLIAVLIAGVGCAPQAPHATKTPKAGSPTPSAAAGLPAGDDPPIITAPALNWVLPLFSDKEGWRTMTLRGSAVQPVAGGSIAVSDLNITIFSGDAEARVDSILLSPSAEFFPRDNRARGNKAVRFIQDEIEVTGIGWDYDHAAKKVSIHQNVRVTFRAQLNDILK